MKRKAAEEDVLERVKWGFYSCALRRRYELRKPGFVALAFVLSLLLAGCLSGQAVQSCDVRGDCKLGDGNVQPVSIISLIAISPELAGSLVRVEGYLAADWEGPVLFYSRESCEAYSSFDGVSLIPAEGVFIDFESFSDPDCRRVAVAGVYEFWRMPSTSSGLISMRVSNAFLRQVVQIEDLSSFD